MHEDVILIVPFKTHFQIPLEVIGGQVTPWFNQIGGGYQYFLPQTIKALLESGIISKL